MKEPTTPHSIAMQEKVQINRAFLISEGWELKEEKSLYETFMLKSNNDIVCSIGLYGEFSISELHWCNKKPEKSFFTRNSSLTVEDYRTIIHLLNIRA